VIACLATSLPAATRQRDWCAQAVRQLLAESRACPDTPMLELPLAGFPRIRFLLKDESVHPTGSLKHRLARSLFLYALCDGRLRPAQPVVDASSGSTAISEAWFARLLGLPFVAVMPRGTALAKQQEIAALGGRCELVDAATDTAAHARELAARLDGCYLDQFGLAGSATDWRGNNNIAQSILEQCRRQGAADPAWIVCGAGTGGTSATIGRYLRYAGSRARLCIAEPAGAAFAVGWANGDHAAHARQGTCIEGIGRRKVEPCFAFELVDEVIEVCDAASIAGAWMLEHWTGRRFGGSSGTNLVAALRLAVAMGERGESGTIVSLLCDRGERYADTLYSPDWLVEHELLVSPWLDRLRYVAAAGEWPRALAHEQQPIAAC
jgi:cysteine synthase A